MPQPPTLKIAEIFPSVQGEGLRQGEPTIFVRFAGCNLRCAFCDTKYARSGGTDASVEEIVGPRREPCAKRYPARGSCLTGGEPYAQNLGALIRRLRAAASASRSRPTGRSTGPGRRGLDHGLAQAAPLVRSIPRFRRRAARGQARRHEIADARRRRPRPPGVSGARAHPSSAPIERRLEPGPGTTPPRGRAPGRTREHPGDGPTAQNLRPALII